MNNKFTVEEVNLICIFECKSRTKVISDIKKAIKYLDDDEMVELSNSNGIEMVLLAEHGYECVLPA